MEKPIFELAIYQRNGNFEPQLSPDRADIVYAATHLKFGEKLVYLGAVYRVEHGVVLQRFIDEANRTKCFDSEGLRRLLS